MGLLGPSFETPAEVQLYASWGMHAVGMSTVWEAIALKHSGARVAGLSLISNLGAGMSDVTLDHLEILKTCRASASRIMKALEAFVGDL
jgi:purine-nucleoside phosphorylase